MKALFTCFWMTGSPSAGLTASLMSKPGWPGRSGEVGLVDECWMWTTGRPARRHAPRSRRMLASASGLLRLPHTVSSKPFCTSIRTRAVLSRMSIASSPSLARRRAQHRIE
jgi:hypothetical protein